MEAVPQQVEQAAQQQAPVESFDKTHLDELDFDEPPIIEMQAFFERESNPNWQLECRKVAYSFHKFGICIVRDPRVAHEENDSYIDMVERYFEAISEDYYAGGQLADSRPELSYQVGVTPESMEKARDYEEIANGLPEVDKPMTLYP